MQQAYIVTGALTDGRTVTLDEVLPVSGGKVRLIVEVIAPPATQQSYEQAMAEMHERQRQRGHVSPTREAVDAYLRAERASWDR